MNRIINFYCDESCHLENDRQKAMVLGSIWCEAEKAHEAFARIREIKEKHGLKKDFEIKWNKVSKAKLEFYLELVDYFFDDDDMHFRGLVIPDKTLLKHEKYEQNHDTWYYKMYFTLLKIVIDPHAINRIFLDIKDTRSAEKVRKLHDYLSNSHFDFDKRIIRTIQTVRSHEVELLQLTDLLIGALSYKFRGLKENTGKIMLIKRIQKRSGYSLERSSFFREMKFNLFIWEAGE